MYRITFVLEALARRNELSERTVQMLLAALTSMDMDYLSARPATPNVEQAGIRVEDRMSGIEDWQDIPTCLSLGVADRRDIACWKVAQDRIRAGKKTLPRITRWPTSKRITFCIDLFKGEQEQELSHKALQSLLMTLMHCNIAWLERNPTFPLLYSAGVRYEEEPLGQEDWQDAPTTARMGFGDCEDLACWRAAELRVRFGIPATPTFTYKKRSNGSYLYHITVRYPDGKVEDPSRRLGMR